MFCWHDDKHHYSTAMFPQWEWVVLFFYGVFRILIFTVLFSLYCTLESHMHSTLPHNPQPEEIIQNDSWADLALRTVTATLDLKKQ